MKNYFYRALALSALLYTNSSLADYTQTQKTILLLKTIQAPLWHSTAAPALSHAFSAGNLLHEALPGTPTHASLFFARTPEADTLARHISPDVLSDSAFQGFVPFLENAIIQEHLLGLQCGQRLVQDNWELIWNGFVGTRERNFWLNNPLRDDFMKNCANYTDTFTKSYGEHDIHAPRHTHPRIKTVHAAGTTTGLSDIQLMMRYRIPLGNKLGWYVGVTSQIPLGALASRYTKNEVDESLPLALDEYLVQLIHRTREILLCAPLGLNGHLGFGAHTMLELNLTSALKLQAALTHTMFRPGTEDRFALAPGTYLPDLEEGIPHTQQEMSGRNAVMPYLLQRIHPTAQKVSIQPGSLQTRSLTISYYQIPLLWSLTYQQEFMGAEQSETAPLATLRNTVSQTHTLSTVIGTRKKREWGQMMSFLSGHYTVAGTSRSWGLGLGFSAQV